jgi:hypothetical protein
MINQTRSPLAPKDDEALMTELWDPALAEDLDRFVHFVYPWGKEGTPLWRKQPKTWQRDELNAITDHIRSNKEKMEMGLYPEVYQSATVSGRGPGKSALVSWLEHWMMTTVLGSSSIITANTETQLKSKTWPEVGKWHTMSINAHWFERTALSVRPAPWFEKNLVNELKIDTGYYFAQAQTWSEENPDAFAGQHNTYGTLIVFDEASGIPKPIWTVSEGFFTEPELHRYWFVFSNGRRNTGPFFECFHKDRKWWKRRNLDSRTVEGIDHAVLQKIIDKHGEDSDAARIEVKGQFPRQGDKQFISREIVEDAKLREVAKDPWAPIIMGVDPARFGDDTTVIRFRQGRDARSFPVIELDKADNMEVAGHCAHWIERVNPDAVCIDAGNGTGIIDRLRELGFKVHEVWFGAKSTKPEWANKRTELWDSMREWLKGGAIDAHEDLLSDLPSPEYKFMGSSDVQALESKESMKARGFPSPDHADALACTFAVRVARKDQAAARKRVGRKDRVAQGVDYPIFGG